MNRHCTQDWKKKKKNQWATGKSTDIVAAATSAAATTAAAAAKAIVLQSNQPKNSEQIVRVNNTELLEIEVHAFIRIEFGCLQLSHPCSCVYVWPMQWDSLCCVVCYIQALIRNWLHTIIIINIMIVGGGGGVVVVTMNYLLPYKFPIAKHFSFYICNALHPIQFNAVLALTVSRRTSWKHKHPPHQI